MTGIFYQNTISSLLQKRDERMRDAKDLRESLAVVGNNIEVLDRTLETLGCKGELNTVATRGNRVVFFHQNKLRRRYVPNTPDAVIVSTCTLSGSSIRNSLSRGR